MTVRVMGAGSWGTAMALLLARNGHQVTLLARTREDADSLRGCRENLRYLPGFILPEEVSFGVMGQDCPASEVLVEALPSHAVHECLPLMGGSPILCVATKGLGPQGELLSETIKAAHPECQVSLLSGPNLAKELAQGIPTAAVAASSCEDAAMTVRSLFHSSTFRIYVTDDVIGVEMAGALKNVLALAAGMSDGLGYGDNTKGTLLSRGLSEIARLGLKRGAKIETFLGVAGVGDLFATANSRLSRNHRVGVALGKGMSLQAALDSVGQVAEGVPTCEAAVKAAHSLGVDVPVMKGVYAVIRGDLPPKEVVRRFMERVTLQEGLGDIYLSPPSGGESAAL